MIISKQRGLFNAFTFDAEINNVYAIKSKIVYDKSLLLCLSYYSIISNHESKVININVVYHGIDTVCFILLQKGHFNAVNNLLYHLLNSPTSSITYQ